MITGKPYSAVSNEFKMLLRGAFGRTPIAPDADLTARLLAQDDALIRYRPASYLHPILEEPINMLYVNTQKERLLHHLLGQPADVFLQSRYDETRLSLDQIMAGAVAGV